ncbi:hypothetical protein [Streptomyces sp. V1I6]|uniref:hypothetical protein n=1 Tax=Streptomyces sp. V1I6 TaxID=3042273 RepID=UPI002784DD25|nr:hypothetical protein [Streptomyces sp. V1I6]MDQ0847409.1 hypothetical protein [Streptomyces sp. V1I6]
MARDRIEELANSRASERAAQKVRRQEPGHRYVEEKLIGAVSEWSYDAVGRGRSSLRPGAIAFSFDALGREVDRTHQKRGG